MTRRAAIGTGLIRVTAAAVAALMAALAGPPAAPARATGTSAAESPPPLPAGGTGCTGPSPVTLSTAPLPQRSLAAEQVWPVTRGDGVLVAVLDTGVAADVPALRGGVLPGSDLHGGAADRDCAGRGTALAGLVAARPVDGSGFIGVAPAATVLPIRITDDRGRVTAAAIADGITTATRRGAQVILVATGVPAAGRIAAAVDAATRAGALVVASAPEPAAAGKPAPVTYPAGLTGVLSVGDLAAGPGTADSGPVHLVVATTGGVSVAPRGSGHYAVSGPAAAAAYVAGAAALVRAYHPRWSGAQVRQRLLDTARAVPGTGDTAVRLVDPYAAVTALASRRVLRPGGGRPAPLPAVGTSRAPAQPTGTAVAVAVGALLFGGLLILLVTAVSPAAQRSPRPDRGVAEAAYGADRGPGSSTPVPG